MDRFRWNRWNVEHVGKHGVTPEEAERAVRNARVPYPSHQPEGKWLVIGRGAGNRLLQVIYVIDDDGKTAYVIHARPLTEPEKRRHRRRLR